MVSGNSSIYCKPYMFLDRLFDVADSWWHTQSRPSKSVMKFKKFQLSSHILYEMEIFYPGGLDGRSRQAGAQIQNGKNFHEAFAL